MPNFAEHRRLKSGPPLVRRLDIRKNIPVSVTKLTLGLRVGFILSHLTANKLFPANPRVITGPPKMSLLLEAKSMPALIIKPRIILVMHTDDLAFYIMSNQQGQTDVHARALLHWLLWSFAALAALELCCTGCSEALLLWLPWSFVTKSTQLESFLATFENINPS